MPVHRNAAALVAAGVLAATTVTGVATAAADTPAATPAASTTLAGCAYNSGLGWYCGYHAANTYSDYGDRGDKVKEIQALLRYNGYDIGRSGIDGKFGDDTLKAVKKFQGSWGLPKDGIVGPATWGFLRNGV
ncbi:peptidoglycan-binding protein [Streptomyces sp. NPDC002564]|uniref:peptidoglycan-binding domain-containing protein n=1 Tax=Streptomyces sp. NPDC002564 TaxID=3364649 RepID=UPI0036B1F084